MSSGQYNTIGGSTIAQSVSTTSTQVVYTFTLVAGQSLPAGTGRTFAAQIEPGRHRASHHRRQLVGDLHQRGLEHDDQRNVLTIPFQIGRRQTQAAARSASDNSYALSAR